MAYISSPKVFGIGSDTPIIIPSTVPSYIQKNRALNYLFFDSFNDGNGITLNNHNPNIDVSDLGWFGLSSNATITNNMVKVANSGIGSNIIMDATKPNYTLNIDLYPNDATLLWTVISRVDPLAPLAPKNYWEFTLRAGEVAITEWLAGVGNIRSFVARTDPTPPTRVIYTITMDGDDISIKTAETGTTNGTITVTYNSSVHNTLTGSVYIQSSSSTGDIIDSWVVER